MRKVFFSISSLIIIYFIYGLLLANFKVEILSRNEEPRNHTLFYDYSGITHVVTSYSRGSMDPKNILLQGGQANIDFLFFTDLNPIEKPYNIHGYNGDIFTFSNQKMSYLDAHILVYSDNKDFRFRSLSDAHAKLTQHFSESPSSDSGYFTVLAHPFKKDHRWQGEYPPGLEGIEVINLRSLWQETWKKRRAYFAWSIATYPFNPRLSLIKLLFDPEKEIELWDYLNNQHLTLGFLGNETTARIFHLFGYSFAFPSYAKSFDIASNHILLTSELTGQESSDKKKIFDSLRKGHFYFAFDILGDPKGFASYIKTKGNVYLSGEHLPLHRDMEMFVDLPEGLRVPFEIEIYKNGKIVHKSKDSKTIYRIEEPGSYRTRVRIQPDLPIPDKGRWFSWIYSNPFYVQKVN